MHRIPIIFTLWPGLPQLWLHGRWFGLAKAIGFALFLNFVLVATYWRPDLIPKLSLIGCWATLGVIWVLSIFQNDSALRRSQNSESTKSSQETSQLFKSAQSEYLRGHLDEAENLLERLIWLDPGDLDARLYLATLFRHRGRFHQAERQLGLMEKQGQAVKWHHEIADERKFISEKESELRDSRSDQSTIDLEESEESVGGSIGETRRAA